MWVSLSSIAMCRKSVEQTVVTKQLRRARESTGVLCGQWFESSIAGVASSIDEKCLRNDAVIIPRHKVSASFLGAGPLRQCLEQRAAGERCLKEL